LEGEANAQIERFVQQGGAYLGLCAGAYYASATVEFDRGGPDEIIAQRDLRLFKGTAIGPVLKAASPETLARPKAALLDVYADQTMHIPFYHAQGCYFEGADGDDEVSVLGRYENGLPAIIHVVHGSGHALLSGVHFEFNPDLLETYQESFPTITCQLRQYETARANFVHVVLKILGLKSWRDVTSLEQNEGRKS
ncbi:MAG: BPL-N domain-containing protein, partial [Holosporales bacterium]